ncbi:MAG TPA: hypothetical protein VHD90_19095 [Phototrophicaceae bacterium]|nr:hypothetical protein [Phototrophicaceae bacterium]
MAYLNREEREKLLNELTTMSAARARGKLRRMDPSVKLAFLRNAQGSGEYWTRLDLFGLGVAVTLIEKETETQTSNSEPGSATIRLKPDFELAEVMVDPLPDNHT